MINGIAYLVEGLFGEAMFLGAISHRACFVTFSTEKCAKRLVQHTNERNEKRRKKTRTKCLLSVFRVGVFSSSSLSLFSSPRHGVTRLSDTLVFALFFSPSISPSGEIFLLRATNDEMTFSKQSANEITPVINAPVRLTLTRRKEKAFLEGRERRRVKTPENQLDSYFTFTRPAAARVLHLTHLQREENE